MAESQEKPEQLNAADPTSTAQGDSQAASPQTQASDKPAGQAGEETAQSVPPAQVPMPNLAKMAAEQIGKPGSSIDLLKDVELNVKIELGRTRMYVEDVLKLTEGAVVELDKLAGDPVDVFVNERLVAKGEVLVLNDNFCVRINQIVADNN